MTDRFGFPILLVLEVSEVDLGAEVLVDHVSSLPLRTFQAGVLLLLPAPDAAELVRRVRAGARSVRGAASDPRRDAVHDLRGLSDVASAVASLGGQLL